MRVATTTLFNVSRSGLQRHLSDQAKLQEQLSTGRKILTPADDPIASAKVLGITQTSSINSQYSTNGESADSGLRMTEATLAQVIGAIQDIQTLAVNAGNATLTSADKKMLEAELEGRYQELLGLANSADGSGIYMFSGFQGDTKPFTESSFGNVSYNGDEGVRKVQISSDRQIPISENGRDVFQRIKNGNGTFVTAAGATNAGSGIVSPGEVLEPAKWAAVAPQDFSVQFYWQPNAADPAKPLVTYDLVDNATGNSLIDGAASAGKTTGPRTYVSGGDIEFKQLAGEMAVPAWDYGVKMSVTGTPLAINAQTGIPTGVAGSADSFSVEASTNVDLFTALGQFSAALNNYKTDGAGKSQAEFQNALNTAMQSFSNSLDNVLMVQSSIGARMKEAESVLDTNSDLQLQYDKTLSGLQDLDYNSALSDFAMNQMLLEATRKSFSSVQNLSLFKYI